MIKAVVHRDGAGNITGFDIRNHGAAIVCAAVSALTLNCVNSIERLTGAAPEIVRNDANAGRLTFNVGDNDGAALLARSLELGLKSIEAAYGRYITVKTEVK